MAASMGNGNVFGYFLETLGLLVKELDDGEPKHKKSEDFKANEYWKNSEKISQLLSHEVTKLSLAFSKPPFPSSEETCKLLSNLEALILSLVSGFYCLPKTQGLLLRNLYRKTILNLLKGVHTHTDCIRTGCYGLPAQLQTTGIVWEHADLFASMPKDNKSALLVLMKQSLDLVKDAIKEIEEASNDCGQCPYLSSNLENENDSSLSNKDEWTEAEKQLLSPCLGLIKVARSLLKKSIDVIRKNGKCDTESQISQFDDLSDHVKQLSPTVDNLASCLYPPMHYHIVSNNAQHLATLEMNLLNRICHCHVTTESDIQWTQFLQSVRQHNLGKVLDLAKDV